MIEPGFYLGDCMDYLKDMPDKSIDLAIVDPPYGINVDKASMGVGGRSTAQEQERRQRHKGGARVYAVRGQAKPESRERGHLQPQNL